MSQFGGWVTRHCWFALQFLAKTFVADKAHHFAVTRLSLLPMLDTQLQQAFFCADGPRITAVSLWTLGHYCSIPGGIANSKKTRLLRLLRSRYRQKSRVSWFNNTQSASRSFPHSVQADVFTACLWSVIKVTQDTKVVER